MFRIFCRNLAIQKNVGNDLLKIRSFTASTPTHQFDEKYEYNEVKLVGTIVSNVRTSPNGTKSVMMRTTDADKRNYQNHQVNGPYEEPITIGQRIYVDGIVRSKQFTLHDGRSRHRVIISSRCIQLRGPEHNNADDKDVNNLKMIAKICSKIKHTDTYTLFTLATSHQPKNGGGISGTVITEFLPVIVYDKLAREIARSLNQFDRVQIEGKVSYTPYKNANGKTQHGGFIVAQTIERVELI